MLPRFFPATLASLLCMGTLYAQTIILPGNVSGTWTASNSPYLVQGQITLPSGSTLNIEPGVQVIFQGHYKFIINGMLQALGAQGDSITFTAADTAVGWHGLRFYNLDSQADSSRLIYCNITYGISSADSGAGDDKHGGVILCSNASKLRISHCLISHNRTGTVIGTTGSDGQPGEDGTPGQSALSGDGGAIYGTFSNPVISCNVFCYNKTGEAQGGDGGSGGFLSQGYVNNTVYGGNGAPGGEGKSGRGGAVYFSWSSPIVNFNSFFSNVTGSCSGGHGGEGGYAVNNCPLGGNAVGGDAGNGGDAVTGLGGAIYLENSIVSFCNNLLNDNSTGEGDGGNGGDGGGAVALWGNAYGGDAGDGGDGSGGEGGSIYCHQSSLLLQNHTLVQNAAGSGTPGEGGIGGYATGEGAIFGNDGTSGIGLNGLFAIFDSISISAEITNSILWNEALEETDGSIAISYSCVEGGAPGPGNISSNPLFATCSLGSFFLSQLVAGQAIQSPCVDAGNPLSDMVVGTTRTNGFQDAGILDIGFHYPVFSNPFIAHSDSVLDFGAILIGDTLSLPLTIYNQGNLTLAIYAINVTGNGFSTNFGSEDSLILPGDSLVLSVSFAPLGMGIYNDTLTIVSNALPTQVILLATSTYQVLVEIEPRLWPINIPPEGGNFDYTISVNTTISDPLSFDAWIQMQLPNSSWTAPSVGPLFLTLANFDSLSRIRTQSISDTAPWGQYVYKACLGQYPDFIWAADSFLFTKLPAMNLVWRDNFEDGNYTQNPIWRHISGNTDVVFFDSTYCLDVHAQYNYINGVIQTRIPNFSEFRLDFDIYRRNPYTTNQNTMIGFNEQSYAPSTGFRLIENSCNNIQTYWNSAQQNQVSITSFDSRWQHITMNRNFVGEWTIVWDEGGPNQTTISGQDYFGTSDSLYLWLECQPYYSTLNGAYFDDFMMYQMSDLESLPTERSVNQLSSIESLLPEDFVVPPNFPNPFNAVTTFHYGLPEPAKVRLTIYNLLGQEVATPVDGFRSAGYHNVSWDAGNMSSGLYFYRLTAGANTAIGKMVLLK